MAFSSGARSRWTRKTSGRRNAGDAHEATGSNGRGTTLGREGKSSFGGEGNVLEAAEGSNPAVCTCCTFDSAPSDPAGNPLKYVGPLFGGLWQPRRLACTAQEGVSWRAKPKGV